MPPYMVAKYRVAKRSGGSEKPPQDKLSASKVLLYDGFFSLPSSGRCSILCQFQKFLIILYYFFVLSYVKAG